MQIENREPDTQSAMRELFRFAGVGNVSGIKNALATGLDINARAGGTTALIYAVTAGRTEAVKAILDAGADTEAKDYCGWTALMHAAENDNVTIAGILLGAGADVKAKDKRGRTAKMIAEGKSRYRIVDMLLTAPKKRRIKTVATPVNG